MTPADRLFGLARVAHQLEAVLSSAEADMENLKDPASLQRAGLMIQVAGDLVHRLVASIDEGIGALKSEDLKGGDA